MNQRGAPVCHKRRRGSSEQVVRATLDRLPARAWHRQATHPPILMQLTLVVCGLLDLEPAALGALDVSAPALTRLLATAGATTIADGGAPAVACRELDITQQTDWPVAPWLARAAGVQATAPYWLCAEPASLVVNRSDVRLEGLVRDLDEAESAALRATLNAHFSNDGVQVDSIDHSHWLLGVREPQALSTVPPDRAIGAPLLPCLPTGDDAPRWRRWQSEIQMLLFEHPVNQSREAAGKKSVNALWLWGGGAPALAAAPPRLAMMHADAWLPVALARARGVSVAPLSPTLEALRDRSSQSPSLAWLEANDTGDAGALAASLAALDFDWFAPARGAFQNGTIRELDIIVAGRSASMRFAARRLSLARRLRAWTSAPKLSRLLSVPAGS